MGYIANWLNDKLQTKEADLLVDATLAYLKQRSGLLDPYMPIKQYDSRNFLAYVVERINTIASVVAYGSNIPLTRQNTVQKLTIQMLKVALSRVYDEPTQWEMLEAMTLAGAKGVMVQDQKTPDGSVVRGANNDLAQYLFGSIEDLVKAVMDTLNVMSWQLLQTGSVNFTDTRTETTTVINFIDPQADYNHFPAALTQTGNTADPFNNIWTDYQYADGLQRLFLDVDTFIDTNGYPPDLIVMSRRLRNDLLQQRTTKEAARQMMASTQVGTVSPDMLGGILMARELPLIKTFDELYHIENVNKQITKGRFLNDNRYVFLTENMGQRCLGPCLESAQGALDLNPKSGVYVSSREIAKEPPVDATTAIATCVPFVGDAKKMGSRQVKP
jgi:hypothetical protein